MSELDRRTLLCRGCALAVAGMTGCVVSTGGGGGDGATTLVGDDEDGVDSGLPTVDSGTAACAVEVGAGWVELPFADHPELTQVGGWIQESVGGVTLNVAHVEEGCFVAMVTQCTHQGGRVDYRPERGQFVCSLHGAVFDGEGTPVSGPTQVPMETYPAGVEGESVWVDLG